MTFRQEVAYLLILLCLAGIFLLIRRVRRRRATGSRSAVFDLTRERDRES